jgi:hypothetical protein
MLDLTGYSVSVLFKALLRVTQCGQVGHSGDILRAGQIRDELARRGYTLITYAENN